MLFLRHAILRLPLVDDSCPAHDSLSDLCDIRARPTAVARHRISAAPGPCSRLQLGARKVSSQPGEERLSATHPRCSGYAILAAAWEPIHPALWDADSRVPSDETRSLTRHESATAALRYNAPRHLHHCPLPVDGFLSASHTSWSHHRSRFPCCLVCAARVPLHNPRYRRFESRRAGPSYNCLLPPPQIQCCPGMLPPQLQHAPQPPAVPRRPSTRPA